MRINKHLDYGALLPAVHRVLELAGHKVRAIDATWDRADGTPVYTVEGRYTTRGWTEWTEGFQYGSALLVYDGTGDEELLNLGRTRTVECMAAHVTHMGVHDHGFNNLSTYGNLRRLMREGRIPHNPWELNCYELAIKSSGAVQASRWSTTADGLGYIYSFNGPHSLFVDTMRSLRILSVAHDLGHVLMGEHDQRINLLHRVVQHGLATAKYVVFHGDEDHTYSVRGRTAHEAVFNRNDGRFRCRSTQQGYSPFSTWTRGLGWAMLGYAEQLEFFEQLPDDAWNALTENDETLTRTAIINTFEAMARATCDHYINDCSAADGITYWDDGAPGLAQMHNWRETPADPYNEHEPVDATASAIGAQALLRLGRYLGGEEGNRYAQAGLTVARNLMGDLYIATSADHQGLLLHSIYHQPNGWDYVPPGRKVPSGESSLWGDYHLLELAVYIQRVANNGRYLTFF